MIIVSIDPGLTGAVGFLENGVFLGVEDMPIMQKGNGAVKYEVSPAGLKQLVLKHTSACDEVVAVLERVNAMSGQGVSSVFSLGDSFGCARSVLASLGLETFYVSPVTWKKYYCISSDKEASRSLAVKMFPKAPLTLKKHVDRAEALLMARWLHNTRYA